MNDMLWTQNRLPQTQDRHLKLMSPACAAQARAFHQSFPQYAPTPLRPLARMAEELGLSGLYVKDESYRFGLNAFKVLGGSYAIARHIAQALDLPMEQVHYDFLTGADLKKRFGQTTFFTATDGNHGRGVAWSARMLGQRAVVRMPKGSARSRLENIAREGAQVTIEDLNYDDCVRLAARQAQAAERGVVVQDTAWPGYEQIPSWIMQGYGTMADEAREQLAALGAPRPTHIFIQAGVGSLAGAVQGYFANCFPDRPPRVIVVESCAADCLYRSALAGDGAPRAVSGDLQTMMAGLACGEVNPISWDILRNHATCFLSCPDWTAALGMRMLGAPLGADARVISGESGAVGMGALAQILCSDRLKPLREALALNRDSHVLIFSTEGDTDPENYRQVVWAGAQGLD